jgi:hypothetical protein
MFYSQPTVWNQWLNFKELAFIANVILKNLIKLNNITRYLTTFTTNVMVQCLFFLVDCQKNGNIKILNLVSSEELPWTFF